MTNPYEAPLESTTENPIPSRQFGVVGCGCAMTAVLAGLFVALSTLFFAVEETPLRLPAPVVAPAPAITPAPVITPALPSASPPQISPAPQTAPQP